MTHLNQLRLIANGTITTLVEGGKQIQLTDQDRKFAKAELRKEALYITETAVLWSTFVIGIIVSVMVSPLLFEVSPMTFHPALTVGQVAMFTQCTAAASILFSYILMESRPGQVSS